MDYTFFTLNDDKYIFNFLVEMKCYFPLKSDNLKYINDYQKVWELFNEKDKIYFRPEKEFAYSV